MEVNDRPLLSAKAWLVVAVSAVLFALSVLSWYLFFAEKSPSPGLMGIAGTLFFIAASWFAVYAVLLDTRLALTLAFPDSVEEAAERAHGLRRDFNRIIVSAEGLQAAIARETESVDTVLLEKHRTDALLSDAEDRLNGQLAAKRQAEDELRQWQDRTLEVIRGIERLVTMEGMSADYVSGAEKVLGSLERQLGPLGLTVVRPRPGDAFDDLLHQATGAEDHPTLAPGSIVRGVSWGVIIGDLRERAEVVLAAETSTGS